MNQDYDSSSSEFQVGWVENQNPVSKNKLRLFENDMEDIRHGTNIIPKGFKYIKLGDIIAFRQEWKEQD